MILRTLSLMVLVYLALGLLVERYLTHPESQVRAFFRVICAPVTRPIARVMKGGPFDRKVMLVALLLALLLYFAFRFAASAVLDGLMA